MRNIKFLKAVLAATALTLSVPALSVSALAAQTTDDTQATAQSSSTGIAYDDTAGWCYLNNGAVDYSVTGLYEYGGSWWCVVNGLIDFNYYGLAYDESVGWWYVAGGRVDNTATGLVLFNDAWWYVENGAVRFDYTGLATDSVVGTWYVVNGMIDFSYNGFLSGENDVWTCIAGGRACYDYTGLWSDGQLGWWYVKDGLIDKSYTGLVSNSAGSWYVVNGMLDFSFNGFLPGENDTWTCIGGGLACYNYTGLWSDANVGWWYVKDGLIDKSYTGFAANVAGTWYVEGGRVAFEKNGFVTDSNGKQCCVTGGLVNTSYTGFAKGDDGKQYYYKNGVLDVEGTSENSGAWGYVAAYATEKDLVQLYKTSAYYYEIATGTLTGGGVRTTENGDSIYLKNGVEVAGSLKSNAGLDEWQWADAACGVIYDNGTLYEIDGNCKVTLFEIPEGTADGPYISNNGTIVWVTDGKLNTSVQGLHRVSTDVTGRKAYVLDFDWYFFRDGVCDIGMNGYVDSPNGQTKVVVRSGALYKDVTQTGQTSLVFANATGSPVYRNVPEDTYYFTTSGVVTHVGKRSEDFTKGTFANGDPSDLIEPGIYDGQDFTSLKYAKGLAFRGKAYDPVEGKVVDGLDNTQGAVPILLRFWAGLITQDEAEAIFEYVEGNGGSAPDGWTRYAYLTCDKENIAHGLQKLAWCIDSTGDKWAIVEGALEYCPWKDVENPYNPMYLAMGNEYVWYASQNK